MPRVKRKKRKAERESSYDGIVAWVAAIALIALGLIPGTEFTLVRAAPLGDPIEIEFRGFALSLRKHEANILTIEEV